jgi:hypothetical protein
MNRTLKNLLATASALALVAVTAAPAGAAKPSEKTRGQSEVRKQSGSSHPSSQRATPRSGSSSRGSAPTVRSAPTQRSAPTVRSAPTQRSAPSFRSAPSTRSGGGPSIDRGRSMSTPRYESRGPSTRTAPAPRYESRGSDRSTRATPAPRSFERDTFNSRPDRGQSTQRREVERQQPSRGPRFEQPQREERGNSDRGSRAPQIDSRGRGDERRSEVGGRSDTDRRQDVRDLGRPGSRSDGRNDGRSIDEGGITRTRDGRAYDTSRSHDREGAKRWESQERFDRNFSGKRTQRFEGSVQRYERRSGGYNVWLSGGHCFFVPDYRWHLWPLRVGIFVTFGGYWNPLGYYNVYDYGYGPYWGVFGSHGGLYGGYSSGYYGGGYRPYPYQHYGYNATTYVQGYVDRFDEQDGSFVVRDDRSGRYISVYMRYDDPQYNSLRVGDWVTLSGTWTRDGYFEGYRIHDVR